MRQKKSLQLKGQKNLEDEVVATLETLSTPTNPKESKPREPLVSCRRIKSSRIWFTGKPNPLYFNPIIIEETPSPKQEEPEGKGTKTITKIS